MKTTTKPTLTTFDHLLAGLRALYDAEVERLADVYRLRILAGEFSTSRENPDDIGYLRLEKEISENHPWLATERGSCVVSTLSHWFENWEKAHVNPKTGESLGGGGSDGLSESAWADECMAHDVLAVAARRGWVKRLRYIGDDDPYALRVAT